MAKPIRLKEIAKKLGLSPATVSQAFNNPKIINRETRGKILRLCEELGYIRKKHKNILLYKNKNNNIIKNINQSNIKLNKKIKNLIKN